MSNFYYVAVGAVVAVSLVWVFFLLKDQWEEHKEQTERKMRDIAIEEVLKEREYIERIIAIQEFCYKDSKLAEKEGEHEVAEL